jgi:DNA-binding NtrC family response regulator
MEKLAPADTRRRLHGISAAALAMLQAYDWPGNIRQLENAVFRASVLCEGDVLTKEEFPQIRAQLSGTVNLDAHGALPQAPLPLDTHPEDDSARQGEEIATAEPEPQVRLQPRFGTLRALDEKGNVRALADVELEMIKLAIDHYNGQMSEVARRLGIGRSTLYRKLKEYGIDPETGRVDRLAS